MQSHIRKIRKDLRADTLKAEEKVAALEGEYSMTRAPRVYSDFQAALRDVLLL